MVKNVYQALYNFPEKYEDRRVKKNTKSQRWRDRDILRTGRRYKKSKQR